MIKKWSKRIVVMLMAVVLPFSMVAVGPANEAQAGFFDGLFNAIGDFMNGIGDAVDNFFDSAGNFLDTEYDNDGVYESLLDELAQFAASIIGGIRSFWNGVVGGSVDIINRIIGTNFDVRDYSGGVHKNPMNVYEKDIKEGRYYGPLDLGYYDATWITSAYSTDSERYGLQDGLGTTKSNTVFYEWDNNTRSMWLTGSVFAPGIRSSVFSWKAIRLETRGGYSAKLGEKMPWTSPRMMAQGAFTDPPSRGIPFILTINSSQLQSMAPWDQTFCVDNALTAYYRIHYASDIRDAVDKAIFNNGERYNSYKICAIRKTPPFAIQAESYIDKNGSAYTSTPNPKIAGKGDVGVDYAWHSFDRVLYDKLPGDKIAFYHDLRARDAKIPYTKDVRVRVGLKRLITKRDIAPTVQDLYAEDSCDYRHVTFTPQDWEPVIFTIFTDRICPMSRLHRGEPIAANKVESRQEISSKVATNNEVDINQLFYAAYNRYDVDSDAAGRWVCEYVEFTPAGGKTREEYFATSTSTPSCVKVPYHYPNGVSLSAQGGTKTAEVGGRFIATAEIRNDKALGNNQKGTTTKDMGYKMKVFLIDGKDHDNINGQTIRLCSNGDNRVLRHHCVSVDGNSGNIKNGKNKSITETISLDRDGNRSLAAQAGNSICRYLEVNSNYAVDKDKVTNSSATSPITCVRIGKKPQLHIMGGDLYSNETSGIDSFHGSTRDENSNIGKLRGTFAQYALLTNNGRISGFGSDGRTSLANTDTIKDTRLMFGNNNGLGKGGIEPRLTNFTPISAQTTTISTGANNVATLNLNQATANGVYKPNVNSNTNYINITGTNLKSRITIDAPDKDVYISNNILEQSTSHAIGSIATLTINANNIYIAPTVNTLENTNLVAKDTLYTCATIDDKNNITVPDPSSKNGPLSIDGACNNQLHITGSISSHNSPRFYRTYGADRRNNDSGKDYENVDIDRYTNGPSAPAEWVDYTPMQWLAPRHIDFQNTGNTVRKIDASNYVTNSVVELPAML